MTMAIFDFSDIKARMERRPESEPQHKTMGGKTREEVQQMFAGIESDFAAAAFQLTDDKTAVPVSYSATKGERVTIHVQ